MGNFLIIITIAYLEDERTYITGNRGSKCKGILNVENRYVLFE